MLIFRHLGLIISNRSNSEDRIGQCDFVVTDERLQPSSNTMTAVEGMYLLFDHGPSTTSTTPDATDTVFNRLGNPFRRGIVRTLHACPYKTK